MLNYFWNGKIIGLVGAAHLIFKAGVGKVNDKFSTFLARCSFQSVGKSITVNKGVVFRYPGNIKVGDNVVLARGVELYSENPKGTLQISDDVVVTFNVRLDFSGDLQIGKNTLISKNCVIETHDHGLDPFSKPIFKSLTIEENVWVGMNSIILSGVNRVGSNSIIAAGSVVTKEVPPNVIVGGIPARIIKSNNLSENKEK